MSLKELLPASALALVLAPSAAFASSQDECAIWICLPGGFPNGCGAAKSAMMDRIEDRKSPLPSFRSCAVQDSGGSQMSYDYNYAALIAERRVCNRYSGWGDHRYCVEWETIQQHYLKGRRCTQERDGYRSPAGCVATRRYVDVFVDGALVGDTYFW